MSEWQPIETAPKDGTGFLIARDDSIAHPYSGMAYWQSWHFRDPMDVDFRYWHEPTHWMPLPNAPVGGSRDA